MRQHFYLQQAAAAAASSYSARFYFCTSAGSMVLNLISTWVRALPLLTLTLRSVFPGARSKCSWTLSFPRAFRLLSVLIAPFGKRTDWDLSAIVEILFCHHASAHIFWGLFWYFLNFSTPGWCSRGIKNLPWTQHNLVILGSYETVKIKSGNWIWIIIILFFVKKKNTCY